MSIEDDTPEIMISNQNQAQAPIEQTNPTTTPHPESKQTTTLLSLPDELLLQILSHTIPTQLPTRSAYLSHIHSTLTTHRLFRLSRDAFFQTYVHTLDLSCVLSNISRSKTYTQVHCQGLMVGRKGFVDNIRRLNLRVHVYYKESVGRAVDEVERVLKGYVKLGRCRVGISTDSRAVGMEMEERVKELLERGGIRYWNVEVFNGGCRVGGGERM